MRNLKDSLEEHVDMKGQPQNLIEQFSVMNLGKLPPNSLLILGDTT